MPAFSPCMISPIVQRGSVLNLIDVLSMNINGTEYNLSINIEGIEYYITMT